MQERIALANRLADVAREIAPGYFNQPPDFEMKGDHTPAGIADREIEEKCREIIEAKMPEDGIIGEEFGIKPSQNGWNWTLDPIDGTKSFLGGFPIFASLFSVWHNDEAQIGIIEQSILKQRWLGVSGQPTTLNGEVVRAAACPMLANAYVSSTAPEHLLTTMPDGRPLYERIVKAYQDKMFGILKWGGDAYGYARLASGHIHVIIEDGLKRYDYGPFVPIIEGAGGFIRDWEGNPLTLDESTKGQVIALSDERLWPEVEPLLR